MTASQKAAFSLLISVFLFAGIAVLAYTGLFDLVETRFYASSLTNSLSRETGKDAQLIQDFLANLQNRFSSTLNEPAIRRSFLPNQSAEDIFERTRIFGMLLESISGLQWVRFVDHNGARLHFSTYTPDIISQDRISVAYRNYYEDTNNLSFDQVQASAADNFKLSFDSAIDRIIFSFPFFDSLDVYRGTALFSVSARALAEWLISENRIKIGDNVSVISFPAGIISGSPGIFKKEIFQRVASIWNDGVLNTTQFESSTGNTFALISAKTNQGILYGRLINEELFAFPQPMKIILLASVFFTIYLSIFLVFNFKQDNMIIIQNRLKDLQISLIENYYERKADIDWERWNMEFEQRRENVREEIKRGIKTRRGRHLERDIDALIDKSWDELLTVIGSRRKVEVGFDEEKLQNVLNRVLQAIPQISRIPEAAPAVELADADNPKAAPAAKLTDVEEAAVDADDVDDLEVLEPEVLEDIEDISEAVPAAESADIIEDVAVDADDVDDLEVLEPEVLEDIEDSPEVAATAEADERKSKGLLALAEEKQNVTMENPEDIAVAELINKIEIEGDDPEDIAAAELINKIEIEGETDSVKDLEVLDLEDFEDNPKAAPAAEQLETNEAAVDTDEVFELDDFEDLDELEVLEDPGEVGDEGPATESPGAEEPGEPPLNELAILASKIEFGTDDESESDGKDLILDEELEIVSPFASLLSSFGDSELEQLNENDEEDFFHKLDITGLSSAAAETTPLSEKPFEKSGEKAAEEQEDISFENIDVISADDIKTEETLD